MLTLSILLYSVLFFCQIVEEEACRNSNKDAMIRQQHTNLWNQYNKRGKKKKVPREHWNVPDNNKADYGKWISEFMANQTELDRQRDKAAQGAGPSGTIIDGISIGPDGKIRGMSIPTAWQGYGVGSGGQHPPPWAIVPLSYGKPDLCFMEPDMGHCRQKMARWGYNSYLASCHQFLYSGCGGNQNNFRTKKRCEESCLHKIQSSCQKYAEYIEY